MASLEGGVDELPCSLVLLNGGGVVVGHARLIPVAGATNAALIESGTSHTAPNTNQHCPSSGCVSRVSWVWSGSTVDGGIRGVLCESRLQHDASIHS